MSRESATAEHQQAVLERPPSRGRSAANLFLLLFSLGVMLPPYLLIYPLGRGIRRPYAAVWYRIACRLAGVRYRVEGEPTRDMSVLLVANHVSYLDIPLLGALTNASFISKSEVSSWPLFGFLAKIADTLFIERIPTRAKLQSRRIAERLDGGESMILFAEGTSSPGDTVLPFKSALFGVVDILPEQLPLTVQPVTLAYTRFFNGEPLLESDRALYGWYGDMELLPHLRAVMGLQGVEVVVTFHSALPAQTFENRKLLAMHCHQQVARGLEHSLKRVFDFVMQNGTSKSPFCTQSSTAY
ncbi:MAG: lysophospholipid acyltransferase family protein [Candidatus Sedimenticola sp. (ex Thyasira tokunagai)]